MPWVNVRNGNIQSITEDKITTEDLDGQYEIDRNLVDLEYVVIEDGKAKIKKVTDEEIDQVTKAFMSQDWSENGSFILYLISEVQAGNL